MTFRCPEHGLLSLRCAHPELAHPTIGLIIMTIGLLLVITGVVELVG